MRAALEKLRQSWRQHWPQWQVPARRWVRRLARVALYTVTAVVVLGAVLLTAARFLLPTLTERKAEIEQRLSELSGQRVHIAELTPYWDGLHPGLRARDLSLVAADGSRVILRLQELRASLRLLPLMWGDLRAQSLVLVHPRLSLERLPDGSLRLTGMGSLPAEEAGAEHAFFDWLFQQGRIAIEDGELQWIDHRDREAVLHLQHVNLTLRNDGERHRLGLTATLPPAMCRECSLAADIRGNPLQGSDWGGELYVRAQALTLEALPRLVREQLPAGLRGRVTAELWSQWRGGALHRVDGEARVAALHLPLAILPRPLAVREASTTVRYRRSAEGHELTLPALTLGLQQPAWRLGRLRYAYSERETVLEIEHLNLAELTALVQSWQEGTRSLAEKRWQQLAEQWAGFQPLGDLDQVRFVLRPGAEEPPDFSVQAQARNLSWQAQGAVPGVRGLSGQLTARRGEGELALAAEALTVQAPRLFRAPLEIRRANGRLAWQRKADGWELRGERLRLVSEDLTASGEATLRLPDAPENGAHVQVRVEFREGRGEHARRYFPAPLLSAATLAWMDESFVGGRIVQGQLLLDGAVQAFPFRDNEGRFELRAQVRDAAYRYLPGWAPVTDAEVDVAILNGDVLVTTRRGRIGALTVDRVAVATQIPDGTGPAQVQVSARVHGALPETLRLLRAVKPPAGAPPAWQAYVAPSLLATGEGILSLRVDVPLGERPATLAAEYQPRQVTLGWAGSALKAEAIEGVVGFTDSGLRDGELRARVFGGDAAVHASTANNELQVAAQGVSTFPAVGTLLPAPLAAALRGEAPWAVTWSSGRGGRLQAELDLRAVTSSLPAPLHRPAGLLAEKLIVRTEQAEAQRHVLAIEPNAGLSGRLSLVRSGAGWEFHNGRVYFLEAGTRVAQVTLPREPGLHVQLRAQQFDVDRWLRLLPAAVPTTATTAAPAAPWLARVDLEARQAVALERRFHQLVFGLQHAAGTWRGTVAADELNGTWRWVEGTPVGRLEANLERLALGERDAIDAGAPLTDPRHLPTLSLQAQSFSWLGHDLGRLDFEASHAATGWSIDGLLLERPEARLVGHGMWRRVADAESTELDVQLTSRDMGQTLAALGYAGQMESGEIEMKGKFGWPSAPGEPRLDRLNGRLELQGENGRFVQVQTGAAGRFLGVVDLSSIGRLLLGDFGSVFGKGFTFDKLHGTITIDDGNAYTRDLSIKGPAAKVTVDGRVALASEQFDLVLDIEPSLGVTVPLLALPFLGPQGAAIVYGLQKLLGDPLSRGTRVTYAVKGPWKNPSVSKSGKWKEETKTPEPAEAPASSGG